MFDPWMVNDKQGENAHDLAFSNFLALDSFDRFDVPESMLDALPDAISMPTDGTFDWSGCIDPSFCLLPDPDFEPVPDPGNGFGQPAADEQSLKDLILLLSNKLGELERGMESRLAQMEENIGQRLTKVEEAKETQDTELVIAVSLDKHRLY